MTKVAISSTCFPDNDLERLCRTASINDIGCIELSGNLSTCPDEESLVKLLSSHDSCEFYVHNYFPPPTLPFVLNFGHPESANASKEHCFKAIDLCASLGVCVFSIHAGMAFNPGPSDLGKHQKRHFAINFDESRELLIESFVEVAEYAQPKGVELLIENNAIADFNRQNGSNTRYHFADPKETDQLRHLFEHPNIGVLLDFGHLKVNAENLGFEPSIFIEMVEARIRAIHLSENDGKSDLNFPISEESWFWPYIPWDQVEYICLEIGQRPINVLKEQVRLVHSMIPRSKQLKRKRI